MDDHVLDVGFVDMSLRNASPCLERLFVIGEDADDFECARAHEVDPLRVRNFAAEYPRCKSGFSMTTSPDLRYRAGERPL